MVVRNCQAEIVRLVKARLGCPLAGIGCVRDWVVGDFKRQAVFVRGVAGFISRCEVYGKQ
jgi:hypothetical protein